MVLGLMVAMGAVPRDAVEDALELGEALAYRAMPLLA